MKILFVSPSYKPAYCYGGTTVSVSELAGALVSIGHAVTIYTTTANGKEELNLPVPGAAITVNGVEVYYFRRITGDHTHVSPALWRRLWKTSKDFDIVHLQSWWSLLVIGAAVVCKIRETTYILSPRGMLGNYSFRNQHAFPKKLVHQLIGKSLLKKSVLHATTLMEWKDCMQVYKDWKGFTLHNIIDLPQITDLNTRQKKSDIFLIGFLSRIDPKKGIELTMKALATITFDYRFMIAGTGDELYIKSLKSLAAELGIADRVIWCGWQHGEGKCKFIRSIDLLVLTSFNENFAMVVTESLIMGTPVLVSEKVGLSDYVKENGLGWVCTTDVLSIRNELNNIYNNKKDLIRIRNTAPTIINKDFNKKTLAKKYEDAYQNVLGIIN